MACEAPRHQIRIPPRPEPLLPEPPRPSTSLPCPRRHVPTPSPGSGLPARRRTASPPCRSRHGHGAEPLSRRQLDPARPCQICVVPIPCSSLRHPGPRLPSPELGRRRPSRRTGARPARDERTTRCGWACYSSWAGAPQAARRPAARQRPRPRLSSARGALQLSPAPAPTWAKAHKVS